MADTIFSKIIKGELPCYKIYEDDQTLAFLDINPKTEGHCVVIPKVAVEFVWDLEDKDYKKLMDTTKTVARHLKNVLRTKYIGMQVEGVQVPHAHVKLIPFNGVDEYNRIPGSYKTDDKSLTELAKKLYFTSEEVNW